MHVTVLAGTGGGAVPCGEDTGIQITSMTTNVSLDGHMTEIVTVLYLYADRHV